MTKEELLERINDIRDELEELADDAESIDVEEKIVRNIAFKMPFADVKQMLAAGEINLFHVGDLIINHHEFFGAVAWDVIGINVDMPVSGAKVPGSSMTRKVKPSRADMRIILLRQSAMC